MAALGISRKRKIEREREFDQQRKGNYHVVLLGQLFTTPRFQNPASVTKMRMLEVKADKQNQIHRSFIINEGGLGGTVLQRAGLVTLDWLDLLSK